VWIVDLPVPRILIHTNEYVATGTLSTALIISVEDHRLLSPSRMSVNVRVCLI
jgi:hypothetical protein